MAESTIWYYISKVTLKEAWEEFKGYIFLSFGLLFLIGIFWVINYFTEDTILSKSNSAINDFLKSIPIWIYLSLLIGCILWFSSGRTFKIPMIDFKLWVIIMIVVSLSFAVFVYLPWWLAIPIYWFVGLPIYFLEKLAEIGKNKIENNNAAG
jgi:hypothetical protein